MSDFSICELLFRKAALVANLAVINAVYLKAIEATGRLGSS